MPSRRVFISYASNDAPAAEALAAAFRAAGADVWLDKKTLAPSDDWNAEIRQAIRDHDAFLACFSSTGTNPVERFQYQELSWAAERMRQRSPHAPGWLYPVRFDQCEVPEYDIGNARTTRSLHLTDLFGPGRADALRRLVEHVVSAPASQGPSGRVDPPPEPADSDAAAVRAALTRRGLEEADRAQGRLGPTPVDLVLRSPLDALLDNLGERGSFGPTATTVLDWLQATDEALGALVSMNAVDADFSGRPAGALAASEARTVLRAAASSLGEATGSLASLATATRSAQPAVLQSAQAAAAALSSAFEAAYRDYRGAAPGLVRQRARVAALTADRAQPRCAELVCRLEAEAYGALLVEGPWGTGKSFHLGRFVQDRLGRGRPTIFVAGGSLRDDRTSWLDQIARQCGLPVGVDPIDALSRWAVATGELGWLVLDATNEAGGVEEEEIRVLRDRVRDRPEVMLLMSRRSDGERRPVAVGEVARHHHGGVDPAAAWPILRSYYRLPAVAVPWLIEDYRRPLILRMFARVVALTGDPHPVPTNVSQLLESWLDLLAVEFAATGDPQRRRHGDLLREVLAVVDHAAEGASRAELKAAQPTRDPEQVDQALDFLVAEGMLVRARRDPTGGVSEGRYVYALQRLGELRSAARALDADPTTVLPTEREQIDEPADSSPRLFALLELAPIVLRRELYRPAGGTAPAGSTIAFVASLQHRQASAVRADTVSAARRLLATDLAPFVWRAAMVNAVQTDHGLGASFIHQELAGMSLRQRCERWLRPMETLLDLDDTEVANEFASVLLWVEDEADAGRLDGDRSAELARMLLWWLFLPISPAHLAAARVLAGLVRARPELVPVVVGEALASGDLDVMSGAWAAVHGALLRSPQRPEPLMAAIGAVWPQWRGRSPLHHRLDVTLYYLDYRLQGREPQAVEVGTGYADFVRSFCRRRPGGRLPGPLRLPSRAALDQVSSWSTHWYVGPDGRPLSATTRGLVLLNRLSAGLAFSGGKDREDAGSDGEDAVLTKYADQAEQVWLAEQSRSAAVMASSTIAAGEIVGAGDLLPFHPSTVWTAPPVDASVSLRQSGWHSDKVADVRAWWLPGFLAALAARQPVGEAEVSARVTEPGGGAWWVLDGTYRLLDPPNGQPLDSGHLVHSDHGVMLDPPIGPAPGRRLHRFIRVRSVLVGDALHGAAVRELYDGLRQPFGGFADHELPYGSVIRRGDGVVPHFPSLPVREFTSSAERGGHFSDRYPSAELLALLEADWTGRERTYARGNDVVVRDLVGDGNALMISESGLRRLWEHGVHLIGMATEVDLHDQGPRDERLVGTWVCGRDD